MPEAPLELIGVGHRFGDTAVVRDVDLTLAAGELVAILGASGAGKTTLLRSIAGLLTPSHGTIRIGGKTVATDGRDVVPVEQRKVGLVFQEYALFPYMDVRRNIAFGVDPDDAGLVDRLIDTVGLSGLGDRRPAALSGGQQQRVALARALAPGPHLLLLDEPFANVDAALKLQLGAELTRILRQTHASAIMVTHDQADAMAHADRLVVLVAKPDGAVVAQIATPSTAYRQPASRAVATLLGPASFVPSRADGRAADTPFGTVGLLEAASGKVDLMIRPEQARFIRGDGAATVARRTFGGRGYRVAVRQGDTVLEAECDEPVELGATGRIELSTKLWACAGD